MGESGVGHQHVHVAEPLDGGGDRVGIGHVALERRVSASRQVGGELLERAAAPCHQAERAAARGEGAGDGLADSTRGAGHEHASPRADLHGGPC
jgi:hypothetical protein